MKYLNNNIKSFVRCFPFIFAIAIINYLANHWFFFFKRVKDSLHITPLITNKPEICTEGNYESLSHTHTEVHVWAHTERQVWICHISMRLNVTNLMILFCISDNCDLEAPYNGKYNGPITCLNSNCQLSSHRVRYISQKSC